MNSIKLKFISKIFKMQITLQLGISEDQIKPFEQALIERRQERWKLEEMELSEILCIFYPLFGLSAFGQCVFPARC